ncbi:MAG: Wzz/FepE/Etk N-terminal domain-containing protein [Sulfitobacter sp.]
MMQDARFYLSLFFRRIHYFLLIAIMGAAAGLVMAFTLPPIYRAQAQLVVEAPQIPGDLASSTVETSAVEILEVIQQRLLTRANLLDLSRQFDVHADAPEMNPDDIVTDMRLRIALELPLGLRERASFVLVSFDAPTGEMSAQVTNELVTQILQQNVEMRTSVAGQTLDFFKSEVARLDAELAEQGNLILTFQEAHKNALPDSLEYRRSRQSSLQERVLQLERELSSLRDRRARLVEIYDRTGRTDILGESMTPEQRQLQQLKDQLASALVIYAPQNPRIRSLEAQIAALEAANIQLGLGKQDAPNITAFEFQLSDIDGQISFIVEQKTLIENELADLAVSIDATPTNSITLGTLERDYDNIRLQYTQATAGLAEARTGEQIEAQSRGQRITVTEQAVVPDGPDSPNRKLIVAAGIGAGIAGGIGLLMLFEIFNNTIRRPVELTNQLGMTTFATIPYIQTRQQIVGRRWTVINILLLVFVGIPGAFILVHMYYMPLDTILETVLNKMGFGLGPLHGILKG